MNKRRAFVHMVAVPFSLVILLFSTFCLLVLYLAATHDAGLYKADAEFKLEAWKGYAAGLEAQVEQLYEERGQPWTPRREKAFRALEVFTNDLLPDRVLLYDGGQDPEEWATIEAEP